MSWRPGSAGIEPGQLKTGSCTTKMFDQKREQKVWFTHTYQVHLARQTTRRHHCCCCCSLLLLLLLLCCSLMSLDCQCLKILSRRWRSTEIGRDWNVGKLREVIVGSSSCPIDAEKLAQVALQQGLLANLIVMTGESCDNVVSQEHSYQKTK